MPYLRPLMSVFKPHFNRPVIVIGMHRSGTSMVSQVLHDAGVFMGAEQDHNRESMPFLNVNQEVMWGAGLDWLTPGEPENYACPQTALNMYLYHFKLNPNRWKYGSLVNALLKRIHDIPWGFKDPRSTYTLPMWMQMYPNAKVIHVIRHPESVVRSLMKRNQVQGEVRDSRLDDEAFCFDLWKQYVSTGCAYADSLGEDYMEVRYEDLVSEDSNWDELLQFAGAREKPKIQTRSHSFPREGKFNQDELVQSLGYAV